MRQKPSRDDSCDVLTQSTDVLTQRAALGHIYASAFAVHTSSPSSPTLEFLRGYLQPLGLFPRTLIRVVYASSTADAELVRLADAFFLDVPVLCALDALTAYLMTSEDDPARVHVWRLLTCILERDSGRGMASLWEIEKWRELFSEFSWGMCCDRIVGWCIALTEAAQKDNQQNFHPTAILPKLAFPLIKGFLQDQEAEEKLCLIGVLLKRFLNRGTGKEMAQTVIWECHSWLESREGTSFLSIVRSLQDPHAIEKFFQELLQELPKSHHASALLCAFALDGDGDIDEDVSYVLFQRLLLKRQLPREHVGFLMALLVEAQEKLFEICHQLSKTWADRTAMDRLPLPQQGYLTYLLTELIPHLPGDAATVGDARIYRVLLEGVSNRLESCLEVVRFQAMRVAHIIAARQPNSDPLFGDLEMDFQSVRKEEEWEETPPQPIVSQPQAEEADSDDESDFFDALADDDAPEPGAQEALEPESRPRTLIDLHQDLRKTDEPLKVISALKQLTSVMKQSLYELPSLAADLSQTLIHVPLPDWIHEELRKDDAYELKGLRSSSAVRVCCLKILLTEAPVHCGDSVAKMVCSAQLAEHQRLEILEALREAARCLSAPPEGLGLGQTTQEQLKEASGKSEIWGVRSMEVEKRKERPTWRNRFVEVAGLWISALLIATQTVSHGFNLMKRNPIVLGGVLVTLGTFADCASQSMVSTSLALSCFPLLKAVMEQKSDNCYLRRCTLQVMASIVKSFPVGRLAAALKLEAPIQVRDDVDVRLQELMTWIQVHSARALEADSDETCRYLAAHCLQSCTKISEATLEIASNPSPSPSQAIHYHIPETGIRLPRRAENREDF